MPRSLTRQAVPLDERKEFKRGAVTLDEIRIEIWDYLYKNGPTSLKAIAGAVGRSIQTIEAAVDHEWFTMRADVASIAIDGGDSGSRDEKHAMSVEESDQILRDILGSGG